MKDSEKLQLMEKYNSDFFDLCQQRHEMGAEEYGPLNFLDVDLAEYILEEIADIANYARFMYIRLRLFMEQANESGVDLSKAFTDEVRGQDELPFDSPTFTPREEISGFLSGEKPAR